MQNLTSSEIPKGEAVLYVDIDCFLCKHTVALSAATKVDGRYYHERCAPPEGTSQKEIEDRSEANRLLEDCDKAPELEKFIENFCVSTFGKSRKSGACVICDNDKILSRSDFKDELSWKEFGISRMRQNCQDSVFGH